MNFMSSFDILNRGKHLPDIRLLLDEKSCTAEKEVIIKVDQKLMGKYISNKTDISTEANRLVNELIRSKHQDLRKRLDFLDETTSVYNLPHIALKIFDYLDQNSLRQSRQVSRNWKSFVDQDTLLWSRIPAWKYKKAAKEGQLNIIGNMLRYSEDKNPRDKDGWTPLHTAACYGQLEIVQLITESLDNKNPSSSNSGWTPMHMAASNGHPKVVKHIIEQVEDKNPADKRGWTPLHLAARYGHADVVKVILENVVDWNPRNISGQTPIQVAADEDSQVIALLSNQIIPRDRAIHNSEIWTIFKAFCNCISRRK